MAPKLFDKLRHFWHIRRAFVSGSRNLTSAQKWGAEATTSGRHSRPVTYAPQSVRKGCITIGQDSKFFGKTTLVPQENVSPGFSQRA